MLKMGFLHGDINIGNVLMLDIFHWREAAVCPGVIVKGGNPCMCSYILKWNLAIRNEGSTLPSLLYSLFLCGSHPLTSRPDAPGQHIRSARPLYW